MKQDNEAPPVGELATQPQSVEGFTVGQRVWFIRSGWVTSGEITGFKPWSTDGTQFWAELSIVDELKASIHPSDLFTSEVPATEYLLDRALWDVRVLRNRLKELAKKTAKKMEGRAA